MTLRHLRRAGYEQYFPSESSRAVSCGRQFDPAIYFVAARVDDGNAVTRYPQKDQMSVGEVEIR
jgi:hypothetical protein